MGQAACTGYEKCINFGVTRRKNEDWFKGPLKAVVKAVINLESSMNTREIYAPDVQLSD